MTFDEKVNFIAEETLIDHGAKFNEGENSSFKVFRKARVFLSRQIMKVKMTFVNPAAILLIVGVLIIRINAAVADDPAITSSHSNTSNGNESLDHGPPPQLKVAKFDFGYVGGPLTIIVWILIASLAKLGKVCL